MEQSYHETLPVLKLFGDRVFEVLFQRLGGTVSPPCPPSPVIASIQWAPLETVVPHAKGSDNSPLTWSDDDALYTTYGDGFGFQPVVPTMLSLGLARITGMPGEFRVVNLRSDSIEQYGEGRKGRKGWRSSRQDHRPCGVGVFRATGRARPPRVVG